MTTPATEQTGRFEINIEPSWNVLADIAIALIENGDGEAAKAEGRQFVRDMGEKLAQLRALQADCPAHLK